MTTVELSKLEALCPGLISNVLAKWEKPGEPGTCPEIPFHDILEKAKHKRTKGRSVFLRAQVEGLTQEAPQGIVGFNEIIPPDWLAPTSAFYYMQI